MTILLMKTQIVLLVDLKNAQFINQKGYYIPPPPPLKSLIPIKVCLIGMLFF